MTSPNKLAEIFLLEQAKDFKPQSDTARIFRGLAQAIASLPPEAIGPSTLELLQEYADSFLP